MKKVFANSLWYLLLYFSSYDFFFGSNKIKNMMKVYMNIYTVKKNHTWPKKLSMCRSMYVFFIHGLQTVIHGTHAEKGRVLPCVLAMCSFFLQCRCNEKYNNNNNHIFVCVIICSNLKYD